MEKQKTKDEIIEEWWASLDFYDKSQYIKKYAAKVNLISHSVMCIIYAQVFNNEAEFTS